MNNVVEQLNEELRIGDGNGGSLILLVDYKHHNFDIFKTYEDKTFSSGDIKKFFPLIAAAYELGYGKLHPEVKVELKAERKPQKTSSGQRICRTCHKPFTPDSNYQKSCSDCKSLKQSQP